MHKIVDWIEKDIHKEVHEKLRPQVNDLVYYDVGSIWDFIDDQLQKQLVESIK